MDTVDNSHPLNRFSKRYVLCIAVLHLGLLTYGIFVHGPSPDEVGHLAAGLSHWHTGRFDLYRVNPPLVRMLATIPVLTQDPNVRWEWNSAYDTSRPEWDLGAELIEHHGRSYFRLLRVARLACLPFGMIALWIVWRWSMDLFGAAGGMLSATVWAFSPMVITNGQLITPDTAAAGIGAVACFAFRQWLKQGTLRLALMSGLALGVVELVKFTWLILFVVWPAQWLLYRFIMRGNDPGSSGMRNQMGHLVFMFGMCIFVVNIGYGFEGTFKKLGDYSFLSSSFGGHRIDNTNDWVFGNRFRQSVLSRIPMPLPENLVLGIDRQKADFEWEFNSYLRGQWRKSGWWYYYFYGLLIKEPAPFVLLTILAIALAVNLRMTATGRAEALNLLFPATVLFVFVSSQTGFNHHLRYVLPAMIFVAVGVGILATPAGKWQQTRRAVAYGLVTMGVFGSLANFPHSHAYFNIFVGGPRNGPLHLSDSNVDWGQDLPLLEDWAERHRGKPLDGVVHLLPVILGVRELTGLPRKEVPKVDSAAERSRTLRTAPHATFGPVPGRYALSVVHLYRRDSGYEYFQMLNPTDYVGYTVRIYVVSVDDANIIRLKYGLPLLDRGSP